MAQGSRAFTSRLDNPQTSIGFLRHKNEAQAIRTHPLGLVFLQRKGLIP